MLWQFILYFTGQAKLILLLLILVFVGIFLYQLAFRQCKVWGVFLLIKGFHVGVLVQKQLLPLLILSKYSPNICNDFVLFLLATI